MMKENMKVILNGSTYECLIDDIKYSIIAARRPDREEIHWRIVNETNPMISDFETRISLTPEVLSSFKQLNQSCYEAVFNYSDTINHLEFTSRIYACNYMTIVMRWLMQHGIEIQIISTNRDFLIRLDSLGLTVAPLGDKLFLYPDLSKFENKKQKHEDVLADDSILTINVRKQKSLKLDFKE